MVVYRSVVLKGKRNSDIYELPVNEVKQERVNSESLSKIGQLVQKL